MPIGPLASLPATRLTSGVWVGIDPGKSGAVAVICGESIGTWDTPTVPTSKKGSKARMYNEKGMADTLRYILNHFGITRICIEKQHAMPDQGVTSMFETGYGFGLWMGICAGLGMAGLPVVVVSSQRWKGLVLDGHGKKDKQASFQVAQRLFPKATLTTQRGRLLDGRCDALCIAEYLRRTGGE